MKPRSAPAGSAFAAARSAVSQALGSVCTCAVLHVRLDGRVAFEEGFGKQTPRGPNAAGDSLFDLASITKLFTATALLALFDRRRVALDDPIVGVLPEFGGPDVRRSDVTFRHLLTHTSGLPAHVNFRDEVGSQAVIARVCATPLSASPGSAVTYSDLGFMLAGALVERLAGASLDRALRELVLEPLGLDDTNFRPDSPALARAVCTERDKWRKRLLIGEVHDENAWAMGGVAGHAGLFGTAADVADLAEMYRTSGTLELRHVLMRPTANAATRLQAAVGEERRGLGWALRSEQSSCGEFFSANAFGHTGYTGTSVWVDPERALTVVLLTNRVYCSRDPEPIRQLRIAVHDAVISDTRQLLIPVA
ncbi:MAG TPA: serine hydrolase domain-containing protein [Candidatus Eremiobacteraceae bacterium]|nr:serine hydrolase domain-containing protein [Candidatus Eremiobacteraceae bacterium]